MYGNCSVAAVIPAFNEAPSIGLVVRELGALLNVDGTPLLDDIVVCNNNSDDDTGTIASDAGVRVVDEIRPGYGAACLAALNALKSPDIVVFVDGDHL